MNWAVYLELSGVFLLEFAVWGAWMPVLAARLLGPLKLSGKQTGWIYATLPLASLIAFPLAGHLADGYVDLRTILIVSHAAGVALLYLASRMEKFGGLFVTMFLYSLFYGATLPLVNGLVFRHVAETGVAEATIIPWIFVWGPIGWSLTGYVLAGLRQWGITKADGSDALKLAAVLSLVMVLICVAAPLSPPGNKGTPILQASPCSANPISRSLWSFPWSWPPRPRSTSRGRPSSSRTSASPARTSRRP